MTVVPVELGQRRYDVVIEAGVLARAGAHLAPLAGKRPVVIVADANVAVHLAPLRASLRNAGMATHAIEIPAGEGSKSWATLGRLVDELLALGVERSDHVGALGGGSVAIMGVITVCALGVLLCHAAARR